MVKGKVFREGQGAVSTSCGEWLNEQTGLCHLLEIFRGLFWRMMETAVASEGQAGSVMSHKKTRRAF